MKLLILGGAGYIGSHMTKYAQERVMRSLFLTIFLLVISGRLETVRFYG
jgi:nucleoside-diphosphate-sugar epimerase